MLCIPLSLSVFIYIVSHCHHVACFISLKNGCFISLIQTQWVSGKIFMFQRILSGRHLGSWLYPVSDLGFVHFIFHGSLPLRFVHILVCLIYFNKHILKTELVPTEGNVSYKLQSLYRRGVLQSSGVFSREEIKRNRIKCYFSYF